MSEPVGPHMTGATETSPVRRRPALLWLLIALLTLEFLAMAGVSVVMAVLLFEAQADSIPAGVAILVLALVATVWLGFIVVAAIRGNAWMRGASIVWQVIMFAIGVGCFQGLTATPAVGWALVLPAVAVIILIVSPPVVRATANRL